MYINDIIRENTSLAQEKQQTSYNRFFKDRVEFKVGDVVKINNYRTRLGFAKAFEPKFLGPYRIVKLVGDLNYQLEGENLIQMVHYNRMLHYKVRTDFIDERNSIVEYSVPNLQIETSSPVAASVHTLLDFVLNSTRLKTLKKRRAANQLTEELERLNLIECRVDNQLISTVQVRRSGILNVKIDDIEIHEELVEEENNDVHLNISSDSSSSEELEISSDQLVNKKGKPVVSS